MRLMRCLGIPNSTRPDQPELRITKEQTDSWMAAAGLKPSEEIELFPDKWFVVYAR